MLDRQSVGSSVRPLWISSYRMKRSDLSPFFTLFATLSRSSLFIFSMFWHHLTPALVLIFIFSLRSSHHSPLPTPLALFTPASLGSSPSSFFLFPRQAALTREKAGFHLAKNFAAAPKNAFKTAFKTSMTALAFFLDGLFFFYLKK